MTSVNQHTYSIRTILNQLINESKSCSDLSDQPVWFGTSDYYRAYAESGVDGTASVLNTVEKSRKRNARVTLNWSLTAGSVQVFPKIQSMARIERALFILSRMVTPEFEIYVFDSFEWDNPAIHDRYIFVEPVSQSLVKKIKSIKLKIEILGNADIWIYGQDLPLTDSTELTLTFVDNLFFLNISTAFEEIKKRGHERNLNFIFDRISECRSHHPGNLIKFQNSKMNAIHEYLWFRQLAINPDWTSGNTGESSDQEALINTVLMHFGKSNTVLNEGAKVELNAEKWMRLLLRSDSDHSIIMNLVFFLNHAESDTGEIRQFLQLWWNVFSLPLFSRKLDHKIIHSPIEISLIIILAMRYRIPFYTLLYEKFTAHHQYVAESGLLVYALFLFSHLQVIPSADDLIAWPGPEAMNNGVQLRHELSDLRFTYSYFSKKYLVRFIFQVTVCSNWMTY